MGISDQLTHLLRNLYVKKQHLVLDLEPRIGSKSGKEYVKAVYFHPVYLTKKQSKYIMWNASLDEAQAGIKIWGRNINNLRYAYDTTLMAERKEELKNVLEKKIKKF